MTHFKTLGLNKEEDRTIVNADGPQKLIINGEYVGTILVSEGLVQLVSVCSKVELRGS